MKKQQEDRLVVRDLNTSRTMPRYRTKEEWLARAEELRRHIIVSCGLYPMPPKGPMNPQVFDRLTFDDYTVEKVFFESYPGFLVTGNLYRPLKKRGCAPGVLSPHGHWWQGRLGDDPTTGSVPGRCINLARQGYVVFSYDMVGYNDSCQVPHNQRTFTGGQESLWGISLMGLQMWNSIRAVDFLSSLPDVDPKRIGCTGESGGGTQTFMLMAIEPRIAAAVPVCMISAHFQGGCLCENSPNLRIPTFNVEIAALMAPRPLLIISATGDWTKDTPRVEYPAVSYIYQLLGATNKVAYAHFDAPHNYNKDSRLAMYNFFKRWLMGDQDKRPVKEKDFLVEKVTDVLVFYGRPHPRPDVTEKTLSEYLRVESGKQIASLLPKDRKAFQQFSKLMKPALAHALTVHLPSAKELTVVKGHQKRIGNLFTHQLIFGSGQGDSIPATGISPSSSFSSSSVTLVVSDMGRAALADLNTGRLHPVLAGLVNGGGSVLTVDCFGLGESSAQRDQSALYFTTYNRTDTAWRVQDILTSLAAIQVYDPSAKVDLIGLGKAGLWCLLALPFCPFVQSAALDVSKYDGTDEYALKHLFVPSLRRVGDVQTAATLVTPKPLLLHNTGKRFDWSWLAELYDSFKAARKFRLEPSGLKATTLLSWLEINQK